MSYPDLLDGLNPQQRQAVEAPPGPTLVIAGPGSGKTAVLTRRVAYLIREHGIPPYRIMAVTFTNKAAREMQERIEKLVGDQVKGLMIGTFHAICARLLRREAAKIGIKPDFVIYDTDDQLTLVKHAIVEARLDTDKHQPRRYLNLISSAKNELIGPEAYPDGNFNDRIVGKLYRRYQELLRTNNALDFDDLLSCAVELFRQHPDVRQRYHDLYAHILVDEFQDTNTAQYALVRLLAGDMGSLFCVGDPDQSIYRFRGADYRNLNRFQRDYPNAQLIMLEHNYRSHQVILDAAMAIIDKNTDRIRKQLTTSRTDGQPLILKNLSDENDEAQYVAWTIDQYRRTGQYALRDCAVMYRTNAQSRALEDTFIRANIPYRLVGTIRFYGRKEVKDVLAYLRLVQNPDDSVSLARIINVPPRGIGKQTLATLEDWAASRGHGLYEAIRAAGTAPDSPFKGRAAKGLAEFGALIERWRGLRETVTVGALLRDILEQTAFVSFLDDATPEGKDRVGNVQELFQVALNAGPKPLDVFLEEIALVSEVDNLDSNADGAVLLTLHAAKGLEFPVVFIVGLEEGLLPHQNAMDDEEQMAEERRLMYVGLTRASDILHLTWVTRRSLYGSMGERAAPSQFLRELPEHLTTGSPVPGRPTNYDAERIAYRRAGTWRTPPPPARTPSARPAARNVTALYRPGQRVRHERFGEGVILASKIRGEDEEIDVRFASYGIKRLSASIAPLVLVEEDE